MGYADQFYELGQEFARDAEARQADIDRSFAAILAEESRQAKQGPRGRGGRPT
ncbi:hypothetical protein [Mycobacteroides abscessus]|uniref:hypothetical protein n=1 Tax=Mycobacteroides abscessus TaxID=36809 RepID=UPI0005E6781F|nr:hypothetical protein [Mycobacteroides abscessus]CPY34548.1 Uncharacterised protein [Mycobacteroides abscessus]